MMNSRGYVTRLYSLDYFLTIVQIQNGLITTLFTELILISFTGIPYK